jgi:hypothetical protein
MTYLCFVVDVRFSNIYTAHQQTTTCFKIDFFKLFLIFFTEFQNERGRNHYDRHHHHHHNDKQV